MTHNSGVFSSVYSLYDIEKIHLSSHMVQMTEIFLACQIRICHTTHMIPIAFPKGSTHGLFEFLIFQILILFSIVVFSFRWKMVYVLLLIRCIIAIVLFFNRKKEIKDDSRFRDRRNRMRLFRDLPALRRLRRGVRFCLHPARRLDCAAKLRRGPRAAGDLTA